eukprot:2070590-Alexandrium_andersonii.AAC.1
MGDSFCRNCGKHNFRKNMFCVHCGAGKDQFFVPESFAQANQYLSDLSVLWGEVGRRADLVSALYCTFR